jgi:hypothetical protein
VQLAHQEREPTRTRLTTGLADSQVRRYTAITGHLALAMAALAVCAITAALARPRTSVLARPPTSPDDPPPQDPALIPLTAAEIKRVFNQLIRSWQRGDDGDLEHPAQVTAVAARSAGRRAYRRVGARLFDAYHIVGVPAVMGVHGAMAGMAGIIMYRRFRAWRPAVPGS